MEIFKTYPLKSLFLPHFFHGKNGPRAPAVPGARPLECEAGDADAAGGPL